MPAVSVIMPVFNAAPYLDAAIRSVCQQQFTDFELLIANDGSVDQSSDILHKWQTKDRRVRVFTHENQGIVATLNDLLSHANGDFIARMDADDICFPTRLGTQVTHFDNDPTLAVLGTKVELIGAKTGTWHYRQSAAQTRAILLLGNTPLCHPSIMVRREVYERLSYKARFPHMEDMHWFAEFCIQNQGNMRATKEILMQYRFHTDNLSVRHAETQWLCRQQILAGLWQHYQLAFDDNDLACFVGPLMGNDTAMTDQQIRDSVNSMRPQLMSVEPAVSEELERRAQRWLKI